MEPKFRHDCKECKFLGHAAGYDMYYCGTPESIVSTVIARYASAGECYLSGMQVARTLKARGIKDPLVTALELAQKKGYVKRG